MKVLNLIKVGGGVLEDANKRSAFLESFAKLEGPKILVHGGGKLATDIGNRLGAEAKMTDGRRITDDEYIGIVTMVYGGLVNKQLVAVLQGLNCQALGLTGADANLILSTKRPLNNGIDFGWVGDPSEVRAELLNQFLTSGIVPVIAPLTHDGKGHMLNTNADTIASIVAQAMSPFYEVHLIYAFELDGVLEDVSNPESLVKHIDPSSYQLLKSDGKIFDGMIPKLDNAFSAIQKGVSTVKIVNYKHIEQLDDNGFSNFTLITS